MSDNRCGKCKWAHWNCGPAVDAWQEISGTCTHPMTKTLPYPAPPEVHLHSGVHCGLFEADPNSVQFGRKLNG